MNEMEQEEAKALIGEIARCQKDCFEVTEFGTSKDGGSKVVVKFNSISDAQNFIENLEKYMSEHSGAVKSYGYVERPKDISFSSKLNALTAVMVAAVLSSMR